MTAVVTGPLWAARNWNINDGEGSIHDDETAAVLGFRGGTVAGDIHMNQFPPVLIKIFGNEWFDGIACWCFHHTRLNHLGTAYQNRLC